jgi:hypothetical protein
VVPDAPARGKGKAGTASGATTSTAAVGATATAASPTSVTSTAPSVSNAAQATGNGNFENMVAFTGAVKATFNTTGVDVSDCNCEPPDTQVAAGNNQVVEAVNNNVYVFDTDGKLLGSFASTNLFQPPNQTVGVTDPRILFDPSAGSSGRYYMTLMVFQNPANGTWTDMGISIAISQTDNPLGSWSVYDYIRDIGGNELDQEKLGFSSDKVTFAVNQYNCKCGNANQGGPENVVVLQKSDLITGASTTPVVATSGFQFDSIPTTPVNTSDDTQYVVWNNKQSTDNTMGIVRITGTPNAGNVTFGTAQTPSIANQTAAVNPVQPGSCTDSNNNPIACTIDSSGLATKGNFESAMIQGNQLWATGVDGCIPQNDNTKRDCTRLVEVDVSNGGDNVIYDSDVGTQGTYRYNPSVMKDNAGHMFFGFTISSSTQYATAATDASALPPPAVFPRVDFGSGDSTYPGSRWGDYSALAQDPADSDFVWSAQEFGACFTACNVASGSSNWATALGQFTFAGPDITAVSPSSGPATGGTTVDIYGSGFANGANSGTSVNFGATAAQSVTFIDADHIQAVTPVSSASGTVDVTATTLNGTSQTSASDQFTFRPAVSSVSPNGGPVAGGQGVSIAGAGFTGTTAVSFGNAPASSFTVNNGGSITAVTPAHAAGTIDVTVTASGLTSQTSADDSYTYFNPPTLSGVSPSNGPAAGGQTVTISGANLVGATSVSFGGTEASSFMVTNSTTITATTPAHAGGTVDMTVTTPGGTSNAVSYTFQFPTTTSLASSANPSIIGASVTYTATISPVPDGGTVAFSDNGAPISTCTAQPVDTTIGKATCTVTYGAVGSHSISAVYSGDFDYSGSVSATLVQKVTYAIKVLYDQTKVNNSGATVPIKVQLDNAAGSNLSSASIVLTVAGLSPDPAPGIPPSGNFTFTNLTGSGPGYLLSVKTTRYPNATYTLSFTATDDPVTHTVKFVIG